MKCPFNQTEVTIQHNEPPQYERLEVEQIDGTPDCLHLTANDITYTTHYLMKDCLYENCACYQNKHCVRTA